MIAHRRTAVHRSSAALLVAVVVTSVLLGAARPATADTTVDLTLIAINDLHRQLAPLPDPTAEAGQVGGVAWLAAHVAAVRDRSPGALFVDAGDLTGSGSTGYGLRGGYADEATVDVMNQMGLDVTAAGNHEFDLGIGELLRVRNGGCYVGDCGYRGGVPWRGADFPTLSANVTRLDRPFGSVLPRWTIRETEGVRVGFVGVTETSLIPVFANELLSSLAPALAVGPAITQARAAGAEVIVIIRHDGSRQRPAAALDPNACDGMTGTSTRLLPYVGADAVIDGHTHQPYVCDLEGMPLLTQAADRGRMLTEITLTYDRARGEVTDRTATNRPVHHDLAADPAVTAIVQSYRDGRPDASPDPRPTAPPTTTGPAPTPTLPATRSTETVCPTPSVPAPSFADVAGNAHRPAIACVAWRQVAQGTTTTTYSPSRLVTRGQMATFIARTITASGGTLPARPRADFGDIAGDPHAHAIRQLADAGIARGSGGDYHPSRPVTRAQMATFIANAALHRTGTALPAARAAYFDDVRGDPHEANIGRVAEAGITSGTGQRRYAPGAHVRRDQMASFVTRLLAAIEPA